MINMLLFAAVVAAHTPIETAVTLKERMWPTSQLVVEKMGREVSLWRPYGIQMGLLREHFEYLNTGYMEKEIDGYIKYVSSPSRKYTDRQITIIQAVVLGEALGHAALAAKEPTEDEQKHLTHIELYRKSGLALLEKYLKELGEVKDGELRFRL